MCNVHVNYVIPCTTCSDIIAFATEPVFASLANVLGYYDNVPSPLPLPIKVNNINYTMYMCMHNNTIIILLHVHTSCCKSHVFNMYSHLIHVGTYQSKSEREKL